MTVTEANRPWLREGAVGGIVAGIVMAMVAMISTLIVQSDLLAPLKQMGALFFANDQGSAISMLAGLMIHMVMSIVFGVIFALIARGRIAGYGPLLVAGFVYIAVEWAIAAFVVLPTIDKPLVPTFSAVGGFIAHLMYGGVLGLWLAWRVAPASL